MSTPLGVNDILQVRIYCQQDEQVSINSLWYAVLAVGGAPAHDDDVLAVLAVTMGNRIGNLVGNSANYKGMTAQLAFKVPLPARVQNTTNATPGVAGAVLLDRQASGLISLRTDLGKPKNRGRLYMPFPAAADNVDPGVPSAGYLAKLLTFATDYVTSSLAITVAGRTATLASIVAHRSTRTGTFITSFITPQKWATQRRRGSFGRPNSSPV